jgi:hypothetical protein
VDAPFKDIDFEKTFYGIILFFLIAMMGSCGMGFACHVAIASHATEDAGR